MVNENLVKNVVKEPYKYGFVTDIETEKIEKGLSEDFILKIFKAIHQESINHQEKILKN